MQAGNGSGNPRLVGRIRDDRHFRATLGSNELIAPQGQFPVVGGLGRLAVHLPDRYSAPMSIKLNCPQCSRPYVLKDELAGKRFRCKDCQELVTIPAAEGILVAEVIEEDDSPEDDWEPAPRAAPIRKSGKKKKKKGNQAGTQAVKILVSVVLGVVGLVLVVALGGGAIYGVIQASKNIKFNTDWVSFTTPDGAISAQAPAKLRSNFPGAERFPVPGASAFGAEHAQQFYMLAYVTLPPESQQLSDEQFYEEYLQNARRNSSMQNPRRIQLGGQQGVAVEATQRIRGVTISSDLVGTRIGNKFYLLWYSADGPVNKANRDRYFNSVQVLR